MAWSMRFDNELIVKEIDNNELNRIFENRTRDHYISEINLEDKEKKRSDE